MLRLWVAAVTQRHWAAGDGSNECIALENLDKFRFPGQFLFSDVRALLEHVKRAQNWQQSSSVNPIHFRYLKIPTADQKRSKAKQNIAKRCKTWILTSIPCSLSLSLSLSRSFTSSPPDIDMISLRISAYSNIFKFYSWSAPFPSIIVTSSSITSISASIPLSPHGLQSHSPAPLDKGQISAW